MLRRTPVNHNYPWRRHAPRTRNTWKLHILKDPPKPLEWRDPKVWTKDKTAMKSFDAPLWDLWSERARSEDMDETLQPFMDMPQSLKDRRLDVPWWANPFGAWYMQNVLALEHLKLPQRSYAEKVAIYRGRKVPQHAADASQEALQDDETLIKKQLADRWNKLEFGPRDQGFPCTYTDYIQFLNEWFKALDEDGLARVREHFDKKIRPLLAVMSHADLKWLEARTQNSTDSDEMKKLSAYTTVCTPEFLDMAQRLKVEINEDYKIRDELGPEMFALWSKAPERWPPERLAKMYSLDFTVVRKLLVWHHFKACYDSCVEPDWSLPKRLFAMEWIRDVRAREKGKFYGRMRFSEKKVSFMSDKALYKDVMNRRHASYANVWEMDDPYRFLQTEKDYEDYWGDNYDVYRRMFPEMIGRSGEPVVQYAQTENWLGVYRDHVKRSRWNWLFAETGVNVGHEPLKKVELDPTNEKRRRFVIRQPDGTMRSAKMSEMRAWYWKEQWSDFRFWTPYMDWGQDTPSMESYQEHHPDTPEADDRKHRRMASRPTKWFYESHYTRTGEFSDIPADRLQDSSDTRPARVYHHMGPATQIQKTPPKVKMFRPIPEF